MARFNEGPDAGSAPAPTPGPAAPGRCLRRVLVAGAGGGIGGGLLDALRQRPELERVFALRRPRNRAPGASAADSPPDAPPAGPDDPRVVWLEADLEDLASLAAAAGAIAADGGALDAAVIATGLLHAPGLRPERRVEDLDPTALARVLAVGATGPLLLARHLLPVMRGPGVGPGPVLMALSARVGSIGDNRLGGWYAYRMAKAALNQGFRTLAVETRRRWPALTVALYHPGTVATPLSAPFAGGGQGPGHERFTPAEAAHHCLGVIEGLRPEDHGGFFGWDGVGIPW